MTAPVLTEIAIRAYSERSGRKPLALKPASQDLNASDWTLVFDCETTVDATHQLRFGFYRLYRRERLEQEGVFYEPRSLTPVELDILTDYVRSNTLELLTAETFRSDVFLKYGYKRHASIVGLNLPFDLSRIAVAHGPARRHMRGGFSFQFSDRPDDPRARVKHLSPRAALIDFAKPGEQDMTRGMRKRKIRVATYRGHFVDIKTLGAALLSQRFSLKSLAKALGTATQKQDTDEHGTLSLQYLDYARADVQVTWECYQKLTARFSEHGLSKSPDRLLSEASVGKAYLQEMGIQPLLASEPTILGSASGRYLAPTTAAAPKSETAGPSKKFCTAISNPCIPPSTA